MAVKIFGIVTFLLFAVNCSTTEPPPPPDGDDPELTLILEDATCTEAWIKLTTTNLPTEGGPPTILLLYQNDITKDTINLSNSDTLLYIDLLLPNTIYTFEAGWQEVRSQKLEVTTMDTTSQSFITETFTFGEHGSSALYDVAIIDENNIWAVGEIYLLDSLGQPDPHAYGLAIWDGENWSFNRIYHNSNIPVTPRGILVINQEEIYLASGSIFQWNGSSSDVLMVFSRLSLPNSNGTIEKLYGESITLIDGIGNAGSIVSLNDNQWATIESGTEVDLNDITGNPQSNEIWVSGYNSFGTHHSVLIKIVNQSPSIVWESQNLTETPPYGLNINAICSFNEILFIASNDGIFRKNTRLDLLPQRLTSNPVKRYRISGTGQNNVYTVGSSSVIMYYNGLTWRRIYENYQNTSALYSSDTKERITVSVGTVVIDAVFHKAQIIIATQI